MAILSTSALNRRFGNFTAVDSFTVAVEAGEIFGLLGPNGAGKSTVVKMLTTLLKPTAGTATIDGFDVTREPSLVRRVIGYVPQMPSADGSLTAYENLLIFARLYGIPRARRDASIQEALAFLNLDDVEDKRVEAFSGGMRRRLEIAVSMLHRPKVLFLDEPTIGLDPLARDAVWQHIRRLCKEHGTTLFMTTHYMDEAESLCHRLAIMHRSKIAAMGTPDELKRSIGVADATLDQVFTHFAGDDLKAGEGLSLAK